MEEYVWVASVQRCGCVLVYECATYMGDVACEFVRLKLCVYLFDHERV